MELVELLDKIDATAPVCCKTCEHMATHAKCDGCLGPVDADPYEYKHHRPGNWLRALQHAEAQGMRNIVIGGQGEAEVNTKWTPEQTSKHLHYVSEQCGYYTGRLTRADEYVTLQISTTEGRFRIAWRDGALERIDRMVSDNKLVRSWPHF